MGDAMSTGRAYVESLALQWAAEDPFESWALGPTGQAISPAELRGVVDDYLSARNPFPDGMSVKTRGLDPDEHEEDAVIVARVEHDEWTVEFEDGAEAWRNYAELSPLPPADQDT